MGAASRRREERGETSFLEHDHARGDKPRALPVFDFVFST